MPLEKNPQKGKTEQSFIRNGIISDKKKNYGRPLRNYTFSNRDYKNVKSKIRKYKRNLRHKKAGRLRGFVPPTGRFYRRLPTCRIVAANARHLATYTAHIVQSFDCSISICYLSEKCNCLTQSFREFFYCGKKTVKATFPSSVG